MGPYKLFKQQGLDTHGEYADNLKTGLLGRAQIFTKAVQTKALM